MLVHIAIRSWEADLKKRKTFEMINENKKKSVMFYRFAQKGVTQRFVEYTIKRKSAHPRFSHSLHGAVYVSGDPTINELTAYLEKEGREGCEMQGGTFVSVHIGFISEPKEY